MDDLAAILASPDRRLSQAALATLGLGIAMVFTHPRDAAFLHFILDTGYCVDAARSTGD